MNHRECCKYREKKLKRKTSTFFDMRFKPPPTKNIASTMLFISTWISDVFFPQILGSSEITKTNEANLHGFCTDSFFLNGLS